MSSEDDAQYSIGDVVLAPFPFADHSITKLRPAILVSTLPKNAWLVIYITSSTVDRTGFDVSIEPSSTNNLKISSIARVNRMTPISADMINRKLGELTKSEKKQIGDKLQKLQSSFVKS